MPLIKYINSWNYFDSFIILQPFGQIPCVVDGDFELFESRAIIRYFAGKYAESGAKLLGETPEERALVDQWIDIEAINLNPLIFPIALNLLILPKQGVAGNKAEAYSSARKLSEVLNVYEKQLCKTKYLAGDDFTLADLTHISSLGVVVERCGMGWVLDDKERVKGWWEEIRARPAAGKVAEMVESDALRYWPGMGEKGF
ncbi:glutathione S-transferase F10-like [Phalaenopsis equestris]|uniref:glutathione S-transferase F10-like n=1 Tax=Phalaenopsis equestris TaxID=78828 RepID=UPI0009E368B4|nr:glutathione S-transferase F10-like [Phalaenopsis equestris]